jgi:hypothetical protein
MAHQAHQSGTTRSDTRSIAIDAPRDEVFAFLADPENLPRWAVGFCRSIRRDDSGRWIVSTSQGELAVRYVTDEEAGTVDFYMTVAAGSEIAAFSRVVPNGDGSEYVFTQLQHPGMPDDVFDGQVRALIEELQVLRALLHARAACAV